MSPTPSRRHQDTSRNVNRILDKYFYHQPCKVYYAPFDVRIPKQSTENQEIFTVVQPDLCVICDESKLDDRGCIGAPDLVIEILSTGNSKKEMKDKFNLYEEAGVKEYWIIDPNTESVLIMSLNTASMM